MLEDSRVAFFFARRSIARGNKGTLYLTILIIGMVFVNLIFLPSIITGVAVLFNQQTIDYSYGNLVIEPRKNEIYIDKVRELQKKIQQIRNADWIAGRFVIASEIALTNLANYRRAWRSPQVALAVVRDVAGALAHAHSRGVLHRDVKPENILIFRDGRAALADFGASRLSAGTAHVYTDAGTFGYLAPEQAYGRVRFVPSCSRSA